MSRLKGAPKSKRPSISVPQEVYDRIRDYARSQGVSMTAVVEAFTQDIKPQTVDD